MYWGLLFEITTGNALRKKQGTELEIGEMTGK